MYKYRYIPNTSLVERIGTNIPRTRFWNPSLLYAIRQRISLIGSTFNAECGPTHAGIDTIRMMGFSPRWLATVVALVLCLTVTQQMVHGMAEYTVEDIATHDSTANGIWVGYNGKVYDITEWVPRHPGGADVLLALAGTVDEFTDKFNARHGPGSYQEGILKEYEIGTLVA